MPLILFLSTGRCGTQFAASLMQAAAPGALVTHEPLDGRYFPRKTLRAPSLDACLAELPEVRAHFDRIEQAVRGEGRLYIETGWPIFPFIPWLKARYGADLVLVHLIREPIRFAFSMATLNLYSHEYENPFTAQGALMPTDPGVRYKSYAQQWPTLNEIERCLYFWLEVHAWAEELKQRLPGPWVTTRARDLFEKPLEFLEKLRAAHPALRTALVDPVEPMGVVDQWHYPLYFDVESVRGPSEIAPLAAKYGFEAPTSPDVIAERFFADAS